MNKFILLLLIAAVFLIVMLGISYYLDHESLKSMTGEEYVKKIDYSFCTSVVSVKALPDQYGEGLATISLLESISSGMRIEDDINDSLDIRYRRRLLKKIGDGEAEILILNAASYLNVDKICIDTRKDSIQLYIGEKKVTQYELHFCVQ